MQKSKDYSSVRFSTETILAVSRAWGNVVPEDTLVNYELFSVTIGHETWKHDSLEEFCADYRHEPWAAALMREAGKFALHFRVSEGTFATLSVGAPTRAAIETVFHVLDGAVATASIPVKEPPKPKLFIGHGRNSAWRDLKDHLQDQHGFEIVAYETGARAGHMIRDILEEMLEASSFALLVLTGEDETVDGSMRARQNVIHEVGLFQGRLGFARAIILLEEGAEEFSNASGVQQIRFAPNRIRETFGDVLATIRREFGMRRAEK